jgi:hypothetical protein
MLSARDASGRTIAMSETIHRREMNGAPNEGPSAPQAVERAVEAAHQLIVDRLELLRLEVLSGLTHLLRTVVVMLVLGISAWATLVAATVMLLATWLPLAGALATTAGIQILVGVALLGGTGALGRATS